MNQLLFPFFCAEVCSPNDFTRWSWCTDINLLSWICFEGIIHIAVYTKMLVSHNHFCDILQFTFPYNWSWKTSLLLGGLLSATDPVAIVALLKELGASKKLSTIIEGESLMNDGYLYFMICRFFLVSNISL